MPWYFSSLVICRICSCCLSFWSTGAWKGGDKRIWPADDRNYTLIHKHSQGRNKRSSPAKNSEGLLAVGLDYHTMLHRRRHCQFSASRGRRYDQFDTPCSEEDDIVSILPSRDRRNHAAKTLKRYVLCILRSETRSIQHLFQDARHRRRS